MRRRAFLAAIGSGSASVAVAGCLAGDGREDEGDGATETPTATPTATPADPPDDENRRYEECSREVVPYGHLPEDVKSEVDAALDGGYEADRVYLREAMDVDESYVSVDDAYYDPAVTVEDGREVLELERVDPKALPDPRPVSVENNREGERTITLELVTEDGEVLLAETRGVRSGPVEFGSTRRVGTHDLHVTVADDDGVEDEVTESVTINESQFSVFVIVDIEEIALSGVVAELEHCRYDGPETPAG